MTNWFANIGTKNGGMYLSTLDAIDDLGEYEWFPTSRDQNDPFKYVDFRLDEVAMDLYKETLIELRGIKTRHPGLHCPLHDYTNSAKAGLLYCRIRADHAKRTGSESSWLKIQGYYDDGHWPLGVQSSTGILFIL